MRALLGAASHFCTPPHSQPAQIHQNPSSRRRGGVPLAPRIGPATVIGGITSVENLVSYLSCICFTYAVMNIFEGNAEEESGPSAPWIDPATILRGSNLHCAKSLRPSYTGLYPQSCMNLSGLGTTIGAEARSWGNSEPPSPETTPCCLLLMNLCRL